MHKGATLVQFSSRIFATVRQNLLQMNRKFAYGRDCPETFALLNAAADTRRMKWQILWETNKFQVSFCSPFKFVIRFFVENKRAIATNKGADQPARTRRLICAFVVRTCIKAGFLNDSPYIKHVALLLYGQLFNGVLIYTQVYFCARINTKFNSSQSHFL